MLVLKLIGIALILWVAELVVDKTIPWDRDPKRSFPLWLILRLLLYIAAFWWVLYTAGGAYDL